VKATLVIFVKDSKCFYCVVYPMLQGSLECLLLIAPSVVYSSYCMCRAAFFYMCLHIYL